MNRRFLVVLLFVILAPLTIFIVTIPSSQSEASKNDSRNQAVSSSAGIKQPTQRRSTTRIIGGANVQAELVEEKPAPAASNVKAPKVAAKQDPFIQKVISITWTDNGDIKAGRRRVRIVKADFKYPLVRLEEEVWTDPNTGKQTVKRLRASVADHLMVGLKPRADEKAAQEILEHNGYRIRAVEHGSYILAELPDFKNAEAQKKNIIALQNLDEFIDFAEPDWLVYPTVIPNDPAYASGKMWGLNNSGTIAGTVADADIDAPEGWDVRSGAPNVIVALPTLAFVILTKTSPQTSGKTAADNMVGMPMMMTPTPWT